MTTLTPGQLYTAREIAAWLRHTPRWFSRNRQKLKAEGFPAPVSEVGQPRWRGEALLAWERRAKAPPLTTGGNLTVLAEVAAARSKTLARRHAG